MANNTKVFTPIAASNHSASQRATDDYYATDPKTIDALVSAYPLPATILEPCCGCGSLSKKLEELGFKVFSEDKYNHGYGSTGKDFFDRKTMPEGCSCIVTNFAYKDVLPMTLHALDLLPEGGVLASFLKTTFLESKSRYEKLFTKQPPKMVLQFIDRQKCYPNGDFSNTDSSAVSYCWMIWEKGFTGDPIIKWI